MQESRAGGGHPATFKTIAAITVGNGLEFFDFTVYSYFATTIGKLFFPTAGKVEGVILSLGIFALSFIARPIGGVVLGLYADRVGRKPAMTLTLILMAVGSLGVACAPTFASIGVLAPIWLMTARLIQGFSLGGEVGASTSLLLEYAGDHNRGWWGSWQYFSQGLNSLLGAVLATILLNVLPEDELTSWGWRLPFFVGVLLVPIGIFIRRQLDETLGPKPDRSRTPLEQLAETVSGQWRLVLSGLLLILGATTATYIVVFYFVTYATTFLGMPKSITIWAGVTASTTIMLVSPIAGYLTDRFGRRPVNGWSRAALVVLALPGFMLLGSSPTPATLIVVVAALAIPLTLASNASIVMVTEMMPRHVRATSLSIVYAVGVALFGGTTQAIATWLTQSTGNNLAPAWYMMVCNVISLLPVFWLKETRGHLD